MPDVLHRMPSALIEDRGASSVEYALLASLIAGVIVLAVIALGLSVADLYGQGAAGFP